MKTTKQIIKIVSISITMKRLLLSIVLVFSSLATASQSLYVPLEQLTLYTDHVFIGQVVDVQMNDKDGKEIKNSNARTGPGLQNKINLLITIHEVLFTTASEVPKTILVPLDSFMHFSLGQIKESYKGRSNKFLVLLEGSNFQPSYAGIFQAMLSEKDKVLNLIKSHDGKPKPKVKLPPKNQVYGLQDRLKDYGYYHGLVDGIMNEQTRQAMNRYLSKKNKSINSYTKDTIRK